MYNKEINFKLFEKTKPVTGRKTHNDRSPNFGQRAAIMETARCEEAKKWAAYLLLAFSTFFTSKIFRESNIKHFHS